MSCVYFVQEVGGYYAPVKIGWATDFSYRHQQLQTGNPRDLRILAVFDGLTKSGAKRMERIFHERFYGRRVAGSRNRTEWFLPDEDMAADIFAISIMAADAHFPILTDIWTDIQDQLDIGRVQLRSIVERSFPRLPVEYTGQKNITMVEARR
jgi:hypothetical protein